MGWRRGGRNGEPAARGFFSVPRCCCPRCCCCCCCWLCCGASVDSDDRACASSPRGSSGRQQALLRLPFSPVVTIAVAVADADGAAAPLVASFLPSSPSRLPRLLAATLGPGSDPGHLLALALLALGRRRGLLLALSVVLPRLLPAEPPLALPRADPALAVAAALVRRRCCCCRRRREKQQNQGELRRGLLGPPFRDGGGGEQRSRRRRRRRFSFFFVVFPGEAAAATAPPWRPQRRRRHQRQQQSRPEPEPPPPEAAPVVREGQQATRSGRQQRQRQRGSWPLWRDNGSGASNGSCSSVTTLLFFVVSSLSSRISLCEKRDYQAT